jgi:SRSO17 transposase
VIYGWSAFGGAGYGWKTSDWKQELGRFLDPFLDRLGHKARRRMCPLYVSGLIGLGDRKSIQPMAMQLARGNYDQLHHSISIVSRYA